MDWPPQGLLAGVVLATQVGQGYARLSLLEDLKDLNSLNVDALVMASRVV
jgi:hypothetical protein